MKAGAGLCFGELALLHNAPRAATVTCESDVKVFSLDMISFKAILMGKAKKDQEDYLGFVSEVPILKNLEESVKVQIAGALQEGKHQYQEGDKIICEGDEGTSFYIIRDGEVKCTKVGAKDEVSKRLKRGDYFGELALIKNDKRAATVTACGPTNVLSLNRNAFERLLGKLEELQVAAQSY